MENGRTYCITRRQADVHFWAELVAIAAVVPFAGWLAMNRDLPDWARISAGALAVGTLAVDGWLLSRYTRPGT